MEQCIYHSCLWSSAYWSKLCVCDPMHGKCKNAQMWVLFCFNLPFHVWVTACSAFNWTCNRLNLSLHVQIIVFGLMCNKCFLFFFSSLKETTKRFNSKQFSKKDRIFSFMVSTAIVTISHCTYVFRHKFNIPYSQKYKRCQKPSCGSYRNHYFEFPTFVYYYSQP